MATVWCKPMPKTNAYDAQMGCVDNASRSLTLIGGREEYNACQIPCISYISVTECLVAVFSHY